MENHSTSDSPHRSSESDEDVLEIGLNEEPEAVKKNGSDSDLDGEPDKNDSRQRFDSERTSSKKETTPNLSNIPPKLDDVVIPPGKELCRPLEPSEPLGPGHRNSRHGRGGRGRGLEPLAVGYAPFFQGHLLNVNGRLGVRQGHSHQPRRQLGVPPMMKGRKLRQSWQSSSNIGTNSAFGGFSGPRPNLSDWNQPPANPGLPYPGRVHSSIRPQQEPASSLLGSVSSPWLPGFQPGSEQAKAGHSAGINESRVVAQTSSKSQLVDAVNLARPLLANQAGHGCNFMGSNMTSTGLAAASQSGSVTSFNESLTGGNVNHPPLDGQTAQGIIDNLVHLIERRRQKEESELSKRIQLELEELEQSHRDNRQRKAYLLAACNSATRELPALSPQFRSHLLNLSRSQFVKEEPQQGAQELPALSPQFRSHLLNLLRSQFVKEELQQGAQEALVPLRSGFQRQLLSPSGGSLAQQEPHQVKEQTRKSLNDPGDLALQKRDPAEQEQQRRLKAQLGAFSPPASACTDFSNWGQRGEGGGLKGQGRLLQRPTPYSREAKQNGTPFPSHGGPGATCRPQAGPSDSLGPSAASSAGSLASYGQTGPANQGPSSAGQRFSWLHRANELFYPQRAGTADGSQDVPLRKEYVNEPVMDNTRGASFGGPTQMSAGRPRQPSGGGKNGSNVHSFTSLELSSTASGSDTEYEEALLSGRALMTGPDSFLLPAIKTSPPAACHRLPETPRQTITAPRSEVVNFVETPKLRKQLSADKPVAVAAASVNGAASARMPMAFPNVGQPEAPRERRFNIRRRCSISSANGEPCRAESRTFRVPRRLPTPLLGRGPLKPPPPAPAAGQSKLRSGPVSWPSDKQAAPRADTPRPVRTARSRLGLLGNVPTSWSQPQSQQRAPALPVMPALLGKRPLDILQEAQAILLQQLTGQGLPQFHAPHSRFDEPKSKREEMEQEEVLRYETALEAQRTLRLTLLRVKEDRRQKKDKDESASRQI